MTHTQLPTGDPCVFDIETCSADELFATSGPAIKGKTSRAWTIEDRPFIRLAACSHIDPTTDIHAFVTHLKDHVAAGGYLAGHNVAQFDLVALCHHHGLDMLALRGKIIDTLWLEYLVRPIISDNAEGKRDFKQPGYDLGTIDKLYGGDGKSLDLAKLARKYGGYDAIGVDLPEYVEYLAHDVTQNTRVLTAQLALVGTQGHVSEAYAAREMDLAVICGQMRRNGFRVDLEFLAAKLAEQAEIKSEQSAELMELVGYTPKPGAKAPWSAKDFKIALREKLIEQGLKPSAIEVTKKTGLMACGKEPLEKLAARIRQHRPHPVIERMLELTASLTSLRTVYGTIETFRTGEWTHATCLPSQASGRWSITGPGWTVFGKRDGRHVERAVAIADSDDDVLAAIDLKQADPRAIAGLSQDQAYMEIFIEGRDVHTETAIAVLGGIEFRTAAKEITNGHMYGLGANKMIADGKDPVLVHRYKEQMAVAFPGIARWQDAMRDEAASGSVWGWKGRRMCLDPQFAYTQGPALPGQNGTREFIGDGLINVADRRPDLIRRLKTIVHDETDWSLNRETAAADAAEIADCMSMNFRGVPIEADISPFSRSWDGCK